MQSVQIPYDDEAEAENGFFRSLKRLGLSQASKWIVDQFNLPTKDFSLIFMFRMLTHILDRWHNQEVRDLQYQTLCFKLAELSLQMRKPYETTLRFEKLGDSVTNLVANQSRNTSHKLNWFQEEDRLDAKYKYKEFMDAGVHFGHLTRKWDPRMAPYIFMERNGIHIIDLNKTISCLELAKDAIKQISSAGGQILFVGTKNQANETVQETAEHVNMPYVTSKWKGGLLTNLTTVRKSLTKFQNIGVTLNDPSLSSAISKRERLTLTRRKEKMRRSYGGLNDMTSIPDALFIIDSKREKLAVMEANKLGIPIIAMCDTNSNPDLIDFPIPSNDDAYKSINLITNEIGKAVEEGLEDDNY